MTVIIRERPERGSRTARHLALGLGVILVWSACFVVINASRGEAPPRLYAGLRALLGGLPLLAVSATRGVAFPPSQAWRWILLLAIMNTTIGLGGMFLSVGLAGPPPRPLDRYEYKVEKGVLYAGRVFRVDEKLEFAGWHHA